MSCKRVLKDDEENIVPGKLVRCNAKIGPSIYLASNNDSMTSEISKSLDNYNELKIYIDEKFKELQDYIDNYNRKILEAIATNSALVKRLIQEDCERNTKLSQFPLKTESELTAFENELSDENINSYVPIVKDLLNPGGICKNFNKFISKDIIMQYNYDGGHGKLSFKNFQKINELLQKSVSSCDLIEGDFVKTIRRTFKIIKVRQHKKAFLERKCS